MIWDDKLSKLIGQEAPAPGRTGAAEGEEAGPKGADGNGDDSDSNDDSEAEPDAGDPALLANLDFKYDPRDPAGVRLGKLTSNDTARYHLIKSECMKAGRLDEWKQALHNAAIELSSTISMQNLTDTRSKKAAKKIHEELQQYASPLTLLQTSSL